MISRRALLRGLAGATVGGLGLAGYAFGIEPRYRLNVKRYVVSPPNWPTGFSLKLAVVADLHASEPVMPPARIEEIVAATNALAADAILLLGDYAASHDWQTRRVLPREWAPLIGQLKAPLGVHAVLGNHDWWDDEIAQRDRKGPTASRRALEDAGIPVYENDAVRLTKAAQPFWLAGLGDQIAFITGRDGRRMLFQGVDDLGGTLERVNGEEPVILLAHEPDIFPSVPHRVALTLSGHNHGGQVRLFGYSPIVPSSYGNRYAYGHIVEEGRSLIVSGGLGCSILPVRFGVPPEIVVVDIAA